MTRLVLTGLLLFHAAAAQTGVAGIGLAAKLADQYGLPPPGSGGIYGIGPTLTYASQRLRTRHSLAREFSRDQISATPFVNGPALATKDYQRHQSEALVARPTTFSLAEIKSFPARNSATRASNTSTALRSPTALKKPGPAEATPGSPASSGVRDPAQGAGKCSSITT